MREEQFTIRIEPREERADDLLVPTEMLSDNNVSALAVKLFIAMLNDMVEKPTAKKYAEQLGCCERTVFRALKNLRDEGYLLKLSQGEYILKPVK